MPNARKPILVGARFGRLIVIGAGITRFNGGYSWRVRCDCGAEKDVRPLSLIGGSTQSCGCYRREFIGDTKRVHGRRQSSEYFIWRGIKARCCNSKNPNYKNYGQRGIVICAALRASFVYFFTKIGERPSRNHTIDRRDNNGNYSCGECGECKSNGWIFNLRWATAVEQNRNRRNNRLITIDNVTQPFSAWCAIGGVRWDTASSRIERGWDVKRALGLNVA